MDKIGSADSAEMAAIDSNKLLNIAVVPNPSSETFTFNIGSPDVGGDIAIKIYDMNGRSVGELKSILQQGVPQSLIWDASQAGSGVYYYQASAPGENNCTGKLVKM